MRFLKYIAVIFAVLFVVKNITQSKNEEIDLKTYVREFNEKNKLPKMLNQSARSDGVFVSGNTLIFKFTMVNISGSNFPESILSAMNSSLQKDACKLINENKAFHIKHGTKSRVEIRNNNGILVTSVDIDAKDC